MYSRTTVGNAEECRTEVEIHDESNTLVAIVYEDQNGWQTKFAGSGAQPPGPELQAIIDAAKGALSHYINRRGENPPNDMSLAALSLWLLEKDDGSILGMRPEQIATHANDDDASNVVPAVQIPQELRRQIDALVPHGKELLAVRLLRQATGCSHQAAKRWLKANYTFR